MRARPRLKPPRPLPPLPSKFSTPAENPKRVVERLPVLHTAYSVEHLQYAGMIAQACSMLYAQEAT